MSQSCRFSRCASSTRCDDSPVFTWCNRLPRVAVTAIVLAACTSLPATRALGQIPTGAAPSQVMAQPAASDGGSDSTEMDSGVTGSASGFPGSFDIQGTEDNRNASSGADSLGTPLSLSSDQIIRILQQNPDLVVELKSQVADRLQQQGTQVDANDITDQMLYNQIATNADLRTNITTFLRARGYVSVNDLPMAESNIGDGGMEGEPFPGQHSLSTSDGTNSTRLAAAAGLDSGSSPSDQADVSTSSIQSLNSVGNRGRSEQRRGPEAENSSTDMPKVLRQPTPYNLQSMRDLYTQIPEQVASLKRFGSEVFVNRNMSAMARGGAGRDTPLDVPLGPDYVVGAGDTLTIDMWGGMTQSLSRVVDRDGPHFVARCRLP